MKKTNPYISLFKSYSEYFNSEFTDRYISFESLEKYLKQHIFNSYTSQIIGYSEQDRPIYSIDLGSGPTKILIWSQMHGNESTTTKAILDFFNYLQINKSSAFVQNLLKTCHIRIIPMLNPDGASYYTRLNANNVDLNRDALQQTQSETQAFFKHLNKFKPDYCFNMHGQRTIFSAREAEFPATLSFLAPSYDKGLSLNATRKKAMKLIVAGCETLNEFIPQQIGRYDDAHNPNCFGDNIQKLGIPTVLFEAGHFPNDYNRNETRRYVMMSLLKMLESISTKAIDAYNHNIYFDIPMNRKLYLDCIIKNVNNTQSGYLGIMFKEVLQQNHISFLPFVSSLDDLSSYFGHRYIDAKHKNIYVNESDQIRLNTDIQNLRIGDSFIDFNF